MKNLLHNLECLLNLKPLCIATYFCLFSCLSLMQCNPAPTDAYIGFASTDSLVEQNKMPLIAQESFEWNAKAWKGEKVHTQMLIWTTVPLKNTQVKWGDLQDGHGNKISNDHIRAHFIQYVMADGISAKTAGCGLKPKQDSMLVADIIDPIDKLDIEPNITQPVWLCVSVPENTPSGTYRGKIDISTEGNRRLGTLNYSVEVINRTLPAPRDWKFHLDLWQNPDAIARVHHVEKWSDEHMGLMKPYMKMLAEAGQKVITATLIHDPWNSQTHDVYSSMIQWKKKKNGSWSYDYTIFDQWVTFMQSLGVDGLIECYSMIPWNLKFHYFDEATGKDTLIIAEPGSREYEAHWKPMLVDFSKHLKEKGWFEKMTIAMDERPMESMQKAISVIKSADKDFKVSLAGNYHPEIQEDLFDYCLASKIQIDSNVLAERKKKGMITTFYTCCVEEFPNTFTVSPPAEATWLGWYAANKGYDGYLRWAYNSWPKEPLKDSRFGQWPSGDTYFIYPGAMSSVRFERLIEGIQDFEKIRILRDEYVKNNELEKLKKLEEVLSGFEIESLKTIAAGTMIDQARKELF